MSATKTIKARGTLAALITALLTLALAASAPAAPVKLVLSSHISGFTYPKGVAVNTNPTSPEYGNVYVVDGGNHRVQELSPSGTFVATFGWDVNETKEKEGSPQTARDVCTEEEIKNLGVKCKTGVEGAAAEQFGESVDSLSVDPTTGDVYVEDGSNGRIDKYTPEGAFVWTIGRGVDQTTKGNICTAASGDTCQAGTRSSQSEGFEFGSFHDNAIFVGGPEDLIYVGDEADRVQQFTTSGVYKGTIAVAAQVTTIAVDLGGDIYLDYANEKVVHELDHEGNEITSFTVAPRLPGGEVFVLGIALDASGHIAVTTVEAGQGPVGALYDATNHRLITRFIITDSSASGLGFNAQGDLYLAGQEAQVFDYVPVPVAELSAQVATCTVGPDRESNATFNCRLRGEVNPEEVGSTEAWFEWGATCAFGSSTVTQGVATGNSPVPVQALLEGLRPNSVFCHRVGAHDQNVIAPEALQSEDQEDVTPLVAPRIVSVPRASFVTSSSAMLSGSVNPENASSEYFFEYAPGETGLQACPGGVRKEACTGVLATPALQSGVYGPTGVKQSIAGLQPATTYSYRLFAENENLAKTQTLASVLEPGMVGRFTTIPTPVVQASTGAASMVGATSAVIAGAVNPDGQPAVYRFELGIDKGTETKLGIVISGPVAASTTPVGESIQLTGLQPGTKYAYRIAILSAYVPSETHVLYGATGTFTTEGLPDVLPVAGTLPLLAVPTITFPKQTGVTPRGLTRAQKLASAIKACRKQRNRKRRVSCERRARKQYGSKKPKGKRARTGKK